jgi:hypothetical protein
MAMRYPAVPKMAQTGSMFFKRVERSLKEIWLSRMTMMPIVMRIENMRRFNDRVFYKMFLSLL